MVTTGEIEVDRFEQTTAVLQLQGGPLGAQPVPFILTGPAEVHVFFEPLLGQARDDDGDGRDEVRTEMVAMTLTGSSPFGPVTVRLRDPSEHPFQRTLGEIEEEVNNTPGTLDVSPFAVTGTVQSFFDVFFEIEIAGQTFHNDTPKHMQARLTHKPPAVGETYTSPANPPTELLDENEQPTGIQVLEAAHMPNPPYAVSGSIRYYSADVSVANATVYLHGAMEASTQSDGGGQYAFADVPGDTVWVVGEKTGDMGSAITAIDASFALQAVVGMRILTAEQFLACDANGSGAMTAIDASHILRFRVGLITRLPVATTCNSDWVFYPVPVPVPNQHLIMPLMAPGTCRQGGISFEPLAGSAMDQDFHGILFGDCNGSWQPPGGGAAVSATQRGPTVRSARMRRGRGGELHLPLYAEASEAVYAADFELRYDPTDLRAVGVRRLSAAKKAMVVSNTLVPGVVRIALASAEPIESGNRPMLEVRFTGTSAHRSRRIEVIDE